MDIRTMEQKSTTFRCPPPPYNSKGFRRFQLGFTLAEMLITLAIIGIIAALTVPTLMNKVQDHGFRSAFLKNYAMIKNAEKLAKQDGNPFFVQTNLGINKHYWDNPNDLKNYFKIEGNFSQMGNGGQNGAICKLYPQCKNANEVIQGLNGIKNVLAGNGSALGFKLKDGSIIAFLTGANTPWYVMIDVNGAAEPNVAGRDVYFLETQQKWNWDLVPFGQGSPQWATCKMTSSGTTCAVNLLQDKSFKIPKE